MAEKDIPNIYILLELDPNKTWSQAEFDNKLKSKQQEWSKFSQSPSKKGLEAKKNLGMVSEIKKIGANSELLSKQAAEAKVILKQAQEENIAVLKENIKFLEAKGYVLEDEVKNLAKEFAGNFSEAEIRKRIKVPIETKKQSKRVKKPMLDRSLAKSIKNRLDSLGKPDLYDFLGLGRGTQANLLRSAAQSMYDEIQKKPKTEENTLISELSGHCLKLFSSEKDKEKYDETLRQEKFESIRKKIDLAGRTSRKIDAAQIEMLLNESKAFGIDAEEALDVIRDRASEKKYSVEIASDTVKRVSKLVICGYCQSPNSWDEKKPHCEGCGNPLQENCPECNDKIFSEVHACAKCGFPVGNRGYVLQMLGLADQAKRDKSLEKAGEYILLAKDAWPAKVNNPVARQIEKLETTILPKLLDVENIFGEIGKLISEKKYYSAKQQLPKLEALIPTDDKKLSSFRKQIHLEIKKAEKKLDEARAIKGDSEGAIRLYQAALRICADCQEARQFITKTPPESPSLMKCRRSGSKINLSWEPSPSSGISYIVVRQ